MWLRFFFLKCSVLFSLCVSVGTNPTEVRGIELVGRLQWACCCWKGKKEKKKRHSLLLPATWVMILLKKISATEKACLQLISSLIQFVRQSQKGLCWHSKERGTWAGRRDEDCLFWWNYSFKCQSKKHLNCIRGLELLRKVQICENFCIKGQKSWRFLWISYLKVAGTVLER